MRCLRTTAQEEVQLPVIGRGLQAAACLLIAIVASPVAAGDWPRARITLGLGAAAAPDYFGASGSDLSATGAFSVEELVLPGGFGFGSEAALPTDPGFGLRGGFRFVPRREGKDGLATVDPAVELGAGLFRITRTTRAYAEVRKGFGGHDGWVGEAGLDFLLRPSEGLVLSAGPRAYLGDRSFMRTYFGASEEAPAGSSGAAFRPEGGIVSLGIELNARRYLGGGWSLRGTLGWRRLQGDAARSPVAAAGSPDQYRARFMLLRTFSLGG